MNVRLSFSAYLPAQIAAMVDEIGVKKATMPILPLVMLGMLAGSFIGLGAMLYVLIKSDNTLSFASIQLLGGLAFCLGLILVVVAGAELFTGNNLIVGMERPIANYVKCFFRFFNPLSQSARSQI